MKRWAVLTAVFALLGGGIIASGCQPNNTASTGGSTKLVHPSDCIAQCQTDCQADCEQSCQDACSACQLGGNTYNCTDPAGCVTCWFDCHLILCSEICSQMLETDCTPSTVGGGSQSDSTPIDSRKVLVEGVDYTVSNIKVTIIDEYSLSITGEIIPLKDFTQIDAEFTFVEQPIGTEKPLFELSIGGDLQKNVPLDIGHTVTYSEKFASTTTSISYTFVLKSIDA